MTSALWEWLKGETRSHVTYVERKQIWVKCRGKLEVVAGMDKMKWKVTRDG